MGILINDEDKCECGAYWCTNGFCCSGHPRGLAAKTGETKMNKDNLRHIYLAVNDAYDKYDDGCGMCGDIDCEEQYLVKHKMLKKKHIINIVDAPACKRRNAKMKKQYAKVLRLHFFGPFTMHKCQMCKKPVHQLDRRLETEIKREKELKYHPIELITLCKRCDGVYKRRKTPLFAGYETF